MAFVVACGCASDGPPPAGKLPDTDPCEGRGDGLWCEEGDELRCKGGVSDGRRACDEDAVCQAGLGCVSCAPGQLSCEGDELRRCRQDGDGYQVLETCPEDQQCTLLGCVNLCERAAEERSYVGCEYWPVTTANQFVDEAFSPAVAVGNPNLQPAQVTLSRDGERTTVEVAPGDIEVLPLTFQEDLKAPFELLSAEDQAIQGREFDALRPRSLVVEGGAYHLVSDVPVTVHQFNPLEYEVRNCADPMREEDDGSCFSQTNDASLLLPTTALTGNYVVVTRPTLALYGPGAQQRPGFVAIVGTQPEPTEVVVRVKAHAAPSALRSDRQFPALAPGESLTVELAAGDVLQLASAAVTGDCPGDLVAGAREGDEVCDAGADYDLTGTEIEADGPVAVVAGHDCAFVPFDRWACDHLEESLFPVESWGEHLVVTRPSRRDTERHWVKVVSASDGNRIEVQPPLDQPLVLDRGESFEWSSDDHVVVQGSAPIAVAQFLIGQDAGGTEPGDPSMSLAIPTDQYRRDYAFLTPDTFSEVYVNLVTTEGSRLMLDGREVGGFVPIGDSGYSVTRQPIAFGGLHRVESGTLVGAVIYGFARYTSFMAPGGLDLNLLHPPPF